MGVEALRGAVVHRLAPAGEPADATVLRAPVAARRMKLILGALIAAFVLAYFWHAVFVPIGSGRAGVLWSRLGGGTVMDRVYQEGYRVKLPWDTMTVYDLRLQTRQETVTVLTRDGLEVSMTVTARFAPQAGQLPLLHRSIGPGYRDTAVWPDVVAAVRHVIRQLKPEDLHVLGEETLSQRIDAVARESVGSHWVDLDRILITRVRLPERIQAAIQEKLAQEQKALTYDFLLKQAELEKQRRIVEADGIREFETRSHVSILQWRGIEATERLAASPQSKVIVLGGDGKLPVLLNAGK